MEPALQKDFLRRRGGRWKKGRSVQLHPLKVWSHFYGKGEGRGKGKEKGERRMIVELLKSSVGPLLLVFFIPLRILNSTISWPLWPMLPLIIAYPIKFFRVCEWQIHCASPLIGPSNICSKLSLTSSKNWMVCLCCPYRRHQGEHSSP